MDKKLNYFTSMVLNNRVWKTVFGPHNLKIPDVSSDNKHQLINKNYHFSLSENYMNEWNELFITTDSKNVIPYTFYWPWLIKYLMEDLLFDLGFNLRNVYHIGHEIEYKEKYTFGKDSMYKKKIHLHDICTMNKDRLMLVTKTIIEDKNKSIILVAYDYVVIQNVPKDSMVKAEESERWNKTSLAFLNKGFSKREPRFKDSSKAKYRASYYCKKNMWIKFGSVSGAISVTHGFWLISRYFRGEEPFMQGMCSGNISLKLLAHDLGENIEKMNVYFNNKLYFPQKVELRADDIEFELFDEKGTMIAFGSRNK